MPSAANSFCGNGRIALHLLRPSTLGGGVGASLTNSRTAPQSSQRKFWVVKNDRRFKDAPQQAEDGFFKPVVLLPGVDWAHEEPKEGKYQTIEPYLAQLVPNPEYHFWYLRYGRWAGRPEYHARINASDGHIRVGSMAVPVAPATYIFLYGIVPPEVKLARGFKGVAFRCLRTAVSLYSSHLGVAFGREQLLMAIRSCACTTMMN